MTILKQALNLIRTCTAVDGTGAEINVCHFIYRPQQLGDDGNGKYPAKRAFGDGNLAAYAPQSFA